jgi:chemotaxis-related protein WspD
MSTLEPVALHVVDCWNQIGVRGNQSCPELATHVHCHNCPTFGAAAQAFLDRPAPDGYLAEMTELLAESGGSERAANELSVVVFEIEDQMLGVETRAIVEVTEPRDVHGVPHRTGRFFSGIVNIHGQLEPCASLKGLLQIAREVPRAASEFSSARMLLVEHEGRRWVFGVDAAHGVSRFPVVDVLDVPATIHHNAASYIKKVLRWGERRVGLLDLDKTFVALDRSLR